MADAKNPQVEILELQLAVAQLQAQLLGTQAELAKYKHRELMAGVAQIQTALNAAKAEPDAVDAKVRAQLLEIAALPAEQLPSIITKQVTDPKSGAVTDIVHQDGRPLSILDRAIMARQEELRAASGG